MREIKKLIIIIVKNCNNFKIHAFTLPIIQGVTQTNKTLSHKDLT